MLQRLDCEDDVGYRSSAIVSCSGKHKSYMGLNLYSSWGIVLHLAGSLWIYYHRKRMETEACFLLWPTYIF